MGPHRGATALRPIGWGLEQFSAPGAGDRGALTGATRIRLLGLGRPFAGRLEGVIARGRWRRFQPMASLSGHRRGQATCPCHSHYSIEPL